MGMTHGMTQEELDKKGVDKELVASWLGRIPARPTWAINKDVCPPFSPIVASHHGRLLEYRTGGG